MNKNPDLFGINLRNDYLVQPVCAESIDRQGQEIADYQRIGRQRDRL